MRDVKRATTADRDARPMARTYLSVLLVQALVWTSLFFAGRYFGSH